MAAVIKISSDINNGIYLKKILWNSVYIILVFKISRRGR
jgi:hypothetical protein